MTHSDDHHRDELEPVIELLAAHRPEATGLELDAVKQRVIARANRSDKARSNGFMRSRAAILTTLVLGFVLSSAGAGLAVTGFAANDQASVAQYPPPATPTPTPTVQAQTPPAASVVPPAASVVPPVTTPVPEAQQVLPGSDVSPATPNANEVQPARQVEHASNSSSLPFTGFAAIPVLLIGLALLSTGLVMRRTSRNG
jgi:hypothetical protein